MKICIISQYWQPDVNGDVTRLRNAINALEALGHKITLITATPHYPLGDKKGYKVKFIKLEKEQNLTIVRLAMPVLPHMGFSRRLLLYTWFSIGAILLTIIFGRCRYIWAFSQRVFSTYTALFAKLLWRAKIVSDITDVWPEALVNTGYAKAGSVVYKIGQLMAKIAYNLSDKITTLTPHMVDMLCLRYGVPAHKVSILPNIGRLVKQSKNKPKQPFTILYYGNLGKNYDFKPLLEAAQLIKLKSVQFIIRGNGERLYQILEKAKETRLENIKIYSHTIHEKELSELVSSADALILPMARHRFPDASFPIKFVEYLCAGKPVIFLGDGYPRHLIERYNIGVAVPSRETRAIVEFVRQLMSDGEMVSEMGSRARELAEKFFSEEVLRGSLYQVFN